MNLLDKNSLKGEEGKLYKKMMDVLISAGVALQMKSKKFANKMQKAI